MSSRSIHAIHPAFRRDIGDLITRVPLPASNLPDLNPFLLLAHHGPQVFAPNNHGLPFDAHPHRGFETVTFILDGELAHIDSGGHQSVIRSGGVQWMTAGAGVVHNEVVTSSFRRDGGTLELLQLWVNLPRRNKMAAPAYTGLQKADIIAVPVDAGSAVVHLVSGDFGGHTGPIPSLTGVTLMRVTLDAGSSLVLPAPAGRRVFFYVVSGDLTVGETGVAAHSLVEFNTDGDEIGVVARSSATILYGHADPIDEPIVSRGPFVMNSAEEISQAIRDYQAGRFGAEPGLTGTGG